MAFACEIPHRCVVVVLGVVVVVGGGLQKCGN